MSTYRWNQLPVHLRAMNRITSFKRELKRWIRERDSNAGNVNHDAPEDVLAPAQLPVPAPVPGPAQVPAPGPGIASAPLPAPVPGHLPVPSTTPTLRAAPTIVNDPD